MAYISEFLLCSHRNVCYFYIFIVPVDTDRGAIDGGANDLTSVLDGRLRKQMTRLTSLCVRDVD